MAITLNDDQVKKLEASILEIPAKYAIPLLQQINGFVAENEPAKVVDKNHVVEAP